jgi:hypothetical protein
MRESSTELQLQSQGSIRQAQQHGRPLNAVREVSVTESLFESSLVGAAGMNGDGTLSSCFLFSFKFMPHQS